MPSNSCIEVIDLIGIDEENPPRRFKKRKRSQKEEKTALRDIGTNSMGETELTLSKIRSISSSSVRVGIEAKISVDKSCSDSTLEPADYCKLDTNLSSMLRKMKVQEMRLGIRDKIEAKYGTRTSHEKIEELSREQCECALGQCCENLDNEVAKLTNQLQNSFIPEKELDQKRIQLLEEQHRIYKTFAVDARLTELARHWRKFESIAQESFGELKIMSYETSIRIARKRVKSMNNEIGNLKFIIDELKKDLKRRVTEEKVDDTYSIRLRS